MDLSLFFEIETPDTSAVKRCYAECIEQVMLADELGSRTAWFLKSHFIPFVSYCTAPEMVLAHLAAKARKIRLGHGIPSMIAYGQLFLISMCRLASTWGVNDCETLVDDYLPGNPAAGIAAFSIGNILVSTALISGGVLERHPNLRVVHLESGAGRAAFWMYRLAAGVQGGFKGLPIRASRCFQSNTFRVSVTYPPIRTTRPLNK